MANTKKGNKPDFHAAAKPEFAKELYDYFVTRIKDLHGSDRVKDGVFQAMMQVALVNDGPVRHAFNHSAQMVGMSILKKPGNH